MNHNNQRKIAIINDISGFGRCSTVVSLPIISHLRVQGCPLPTSIFSNHTGFESYFFDDYTDKMESYIAEWKKLGLSFNGIYSGFLGSEKQIDIVEGFIKDFKKPNTKIIIDPVMGDYGRMYATYTQGMCSAMARLVGYADIVTPNITEACILTNTEYTDKRWKKEELSAIAVRLQQMGSKNVVITGIKQGPFVANFVRNEAGEEKIIKLHLVGKERSGTGDVFAAVLAADAVNNVEIFKSVKRASKFVSRCVMATDKYEMPSTDGLCFEEVLYKLKPERS